MRTKEIVSIEAAPLEIALRRPFAISGGTQEAAAIVAVLVELADGTVGLGEAAPLPAFNGETEADVRAVSDAMCKALLGFQPDEWRDVRALLEPHARAAGRFIASALCAYEVAVLDAWLRHSHQSMRQYFGGRRRHLLSDFTITQTHEVDESAALRAAINEASEALSHGASTMKIKVGGVPRDLDLLRVRAVHEVAPAAELILDANGAFTSVAAGEFVEKLSSEGIAIRLFEQPVHEDDLDGMAMLRSELKIRIAADESVRGLEDVVRIHRAGAADVVNVKLQKTGVFEALSIVEFCRANDIGLMIGGMVETNLGMGVSASLAAGIGDFEVVDLDTPLFMSTSPFVGGPVWKGVTISVAEDLLGHGLALRPGLLSCHGGPTSRLLCAASAVSKSVR